MSEVKRFFTALGFDPEPYVEMIEDTDGTYVYYEDYETLRAQLAEAQKEAYPAYKREKALRCKAENELSEAQKEIEMLKHSANEKLNLCRDHWQRGMRLNIERAEKAEAENASLRARLKGMEEVYQKINTAPDGLANTTYDFFHEMYFAICAACEGE